MAIFVVERLWVVVLMPEKRISNKQLFSYKLVTTPRKEFRRA